jgi:hypothetical protein
MGRSLVRQRPGSGVPHRDPGRGCAAGRPLRLARQIGAPAASWHRGCPLPSGSAALLRQNAAVMLVKSDCRQSGGGPSTLSAALTHILIGIFPSLIYDGQDWWLTTICCWLDRWEMHPERLSRRENSGLRGRRYPHSRHKVLLWRRWWRGSNVTCICSRMHSKVGRRLAWARKSQVAPTLIRRNSNVSAFTRDYWELSKRLPPLALLS